MRRMLSTLASAFLSLALGCSLPVLAQSHGAAVDPAAPKLAKVEAFHLPFGRVPAAQVRLEAPLPEAIASLKVANSRSRTKMLEIGFGREVPAMARTTPLAWLEVPGGMAAHIEVTSSEALALRVGLAVVRLPRGAELRFAGADRMDVVYGPFTAMDVLAAGGTYWSPVLEGETATVEVFVPAGIAHAQVSLGVGLVSHLFVSPSHPEAEKLAKAAQFCEVDFICRATSDAQLAQTGRSVARMTFTGSGGGTAFCTGTLLNPSDNSFTPYFYGAAHCISTQARASTLTTHWNYETTSCGGGTVSPSYVQVGGGATLLYANTSSDALLLRLNQSPPSNAVFAGWDAATPAVGTSMTAIHHPDGDFKKVSLGRVGGFGGAGSLASGEFMRIDWLGISTGVTEGGSSGSGIFSGNSSAGYRFRGGLLGGPSSCSAGPSELFDYYSRFDQVFTFLAQYLNPGPVVPDGPNILANPGFESGRTVWTETSSGGFALITQSSTGARQGNWYALLGGANNLTESLSQSFTVPSGNARVRFYYRISTEETLAQDFDVMTVSLVNASGSTLTTLATYSNQTTTSGYAQSAAYDISAFAGQSVRLQFRVTTDGSLDTFFAIDDVSVSGTTTSGGTNYTALWWNPAQSGWGVNVNQQGDVIFATLFTYDTDGTPMWLVMSGGTRQGSTDVFSGDLYRTTGPVFNAVPFTPITGANLTRVGTMTLAFSGANAGTLTYSVNIVAVSKTIERQVFGARAASCSGASGSRANATNYQDLWWNSAESGWGINLTQQGDVIFATLFTYGANNQGLWLVMSGGTRQGDGSYFGELYRTTGPAFNANPWTNVTATPVGTMRLRFINGETGTLEYTVNGVTVSKVIARQVFGGSPPLCVS